MFNGVSERFAVPAEVIGWLRRLQWRLICVGVLTPEGVRHGGECRVASFLLQGPFTDEPNCRDQSIRIGPQGLSVVGGPIDAFAFFAALSTWGHVLWDTRHTRGNVQPGGYHGPESAV